jgi:hypothetical protein
MALIAPLLIGFPVMSMGRMMGGYGSSPGVYGPPLGYGTGFLGLGLLWIFGALLAALAGAIFTWIYNAVNNVRAREGSTPKAASHLPMSG